MLPLQPAEILTNLGLRASKARGQNFLKDPNYINKIISSILEETKDKVILEIGPGLGALTIPLLEKGLAVHAVELDKGLALNLKQFESVYPNQITIYNQDILKFNPENLVNGKKNLLFYGNLPYNISTPILFWFLEYINIASAGIFMLQKEMADRLTAKVGSKDYSRLTIALNLWLNIKVLTNVPPSAFFPRPTVDSTVVKLSPKSIVPNININKFSSFTSTAFLARRKTLINNLLKKYSKERIETSLQTLNITLNARAETISPEGFLELYKILEKGDNNDRYKN